MPGWMLRAVGEVVVVEHQVDVVGQHAQLVEHGRSTASTG